MDGVNLGHKSAIVNPDRTYGVTFFKDVFAKTKDERKLTFDGLEDELEHRSAPVKTMLPMFRFARFGDKPDGDKCLRYDENVTAYTGAIGDYDAEKVPMADAYEKLKEYGVKAILYTTARNTPSTPRWRVVAPYAEPIIVDPADPEAAAKKHIEYMNMLNGVVGGVLAGESWNRSLAFYYGYVDTKQNDYEFFVVDGQEIDTIEGLPSQGKPVSKTTVKRTADPAADDGSRLPRKLDYIAADWRERIETGNAAEYGNDRSRLVAAVARYLIEMGWQDADVYALLTDERFGVSAHCIENGAERAATRAIELAHIPPVDVADLNKHYAFTIMRGKSAIIRERTDIEGSPTYDLLQIATFKDMLRNRFVQVGKKRITLANLWLDSPHRRQYPKGLAFAPGHEMPGYFNIWYGFAVEPKEGDCTLFLNHIKTNIAQGDMGHFAWIVAWLADIIQNPIKKPGTALVLRGKQGTGKSIIVQIMRKLLGVHCVSLSKAGHFTGRFNSRLDKCLLLGAEEAFWAGDKEAEGVLKDLIRHNPLLLLIPGAGHPQGSRMKSLWELIPLGDETPRFETAGPLSAGEAFSCRSLRHAQS